MCVCVCVCVCACIVFIQYMHDILNSSESKGALIEGGSKKETDINSFTFVSNHSYFNENDKTSGRCRVYNLLVSPHKS